MTYPIAAVMLIQSGKQSTGEKIYMENNNRKGPRPFTREEKEMILKAQKEHEEKKKNDPEYKKVWEKRRADLEKFTFQNDTIE